MLRLRAAGNCDQCSAAACGGLRSRSRRTPRPSSSSSSTRRRRWSRMRRSSVINNQTGRVARGDVRQRRHRRRSPALPLTGTLHGHGHQGRVSARGRQGRRRCAPAKPRRCSVKLVVGARARAEVTVYGTTKACAPTRRSAGASTATTIDETPILGRKITTLPLFNSAFRQGKGTGDLFVNATYFVTGVGGRRTDHLHARRRQQRRGVGTADDAGDGAGRRGAGNRRALERVLGGVRLDRRPRASTSSPSRAPTACTAKGCTWRGPAAAGQDVLAPTALSAVGRRAAPTPAHAHRDQLPPDMPDELEQVSGTIGGAAGQGSRRSSSPRPTTRSRIERRTCRPRCRRSCCRHGSLTYVGKYRQALVDARVDHKLTPHTDADGPRSTSIGSTTPTRNDAVVGTTRAERRARDTRAHLVGAGQPHRGPQLDAC